jgi:hypothetical protein
MGNQIKFAAANLPADPDQLMHLAQQIIDQHVKKGVQSPHQANHVADLSYKLKYVKDKHDEGLKYKKLMEEAWTDRDHYLGIGHQESFGLIHKISVLLKDLDRQ